jgi:hypothetical protein
MDNDIKSSWTTSIVGSIIGGLVVFLLLKNIIESQKATLQLQQQQIYQYQQMQSTMMQRYVPIQQSPIQQLSSFVDAGYKNDEVWEIERGNNGFISKVRAGRDAKVTRLN